MSDEDRKSLEEDNFEVEELKDAELEDASGGNNNVNESQCISPATVETGS